MVAVEILEEVVADVAGLAVLAQRLFDELEVVLVVLLAEGDTQEMRKRSVMSSVNQSPSSMGMTLSSSGREAIGFRWNPLFR